MAFQGVGRMQGTAGQDKMFPIDEDSLARMQAIALQYLAEGKHDPTVQTVANHIIYQAGLSPEHASNMDRAAALHRYVADVLPYTPDPDGFERMQSPVRMASLIMSGMTPEGDCDDKAVFLASLAINSGIPASVAFLDTDKDGTIDHAMTTMLLGGEVVFAETTEVGIPLGWRPPTASVQVLQLQS